ncbi:MAG: hypothetical protein KGJ13_09535 [Patescibacteria group bacterium]|nr:hypothetical protein [Patescibacteria group bacterium]
MAKHKPNQVGLTIHEYIRYFKPRKIPMHAICTAYNQNWRFEEALQHFEVWYKDKIEEPKRRRHLGLATVQRMFLRGVNELAGDLYDRAAPDALLWLERFLEPERRELERKRRRTMPDGTLLPHVGTLPESRLYLSKAERQAEDDALFRQDSESLKRAYAEKKAAEEKSA